MFPLLLSSEPLDFADSRLLPVSFSLALPELAIIAGLTSMQARQQALPWFMAATKNIIAPVLGDSKQCWIEHTSLAVRAACDYTADMQSLAAPYKMQH